MFIVWDARNGHVLPARDISQPVTVVFGYDRGAADALAARLNLYVARNMLGFEPAAPPTGPFYVRRAETRAQLEGVGFGGSR